jgi:hypothetical protein
MIRLAANTLALAILSTLACCDPSTALAASTSQPATEPAKTFALFPASPTGQAIYITTPAPATVHVDALDLVDHPTDWLAEQFNWDFGDSAGPKLYNGQPLSSALHGPVAAYQYTQPGTHTVHLTRTLANGSTLTYSATLVIPAPQRTTFYIAPDGNDTNPGTDIHHPLATASAAIKLVANHTAFYFRRGGVYTFEPEFAVKHTDILIDSYGNPGLPLPILKRTPAPNNKPEDAMTFTTWPGQTADVTIQNVRIDSNWTKAETAGHYAYHAPAATFGILRGSNVTIANCEFANLVEGPHGDLTANGLLLLNNRQVDPLGIPSRTLWLQGSQVVAIGNTALNSVNESPFRAADTGINRGLIAFNTVAQQLDPAHDRSSAKAAITLRTLCDVAVLNNTITDGECSFDPHAAGTYDQRILVANNTVTGAMIDIKTDVRHAVFRNNSITRNQGPCITINPGSSDPTQWIEDLQLINNTARGWSPNSRLLQINPYGPNQFRGFICDSKTNTFTKIAPPPEAR